MVFLDLEDAVAPLEKPAARAKVVKATGQRLLVDTSHAPTRTRIRVAAERMQQERSRKLVQAGVDRVSLLTTVPYGVPLRRAFAERAKRLSR